MKLLASLLGAAAADYACCPYDNFGVVFEHCPLTEKTPWAMDGATPPAADPLGVEHHLCKAWEANVDATFEGTEDYDNWGGCGFQRHFPWFWGTNGEFMEQSVGGTPNAVNLNSMHCTLGYMQCTGANYFTNYRGFQVGTNTFRLDTHASPFTGGTVSNGVHSGHAVVVGQVHLGAVCKLWIPVRLKFIDSVQISGVHMRGGGVPPSNPVVANDVHSNDNHDGQSAAVFNDAKVCADGSCTTGTAMAHGTAYCFSVVNIGEFMENYHEGQSNKGAASFNVMNGNVAGMDSNGHDPIKLPGPLSRQEYDVHFGEPLDHTNFVSGSNPGGATIVESGANFDVVVHFKSQWCMRHWKKVDLQQVDNAGSNNGHHDWGSNVLDYEVTSSNVNTPHHHHTDVADKRFDARVGICGCCNAAGNRHDDPNTHWDFTNSAPLAATVGTTDAESCTRCDGAVTGSIYENCDTINFYNDVFDTNGAHVNGGYKWPNAGAWAAFYSFITCSNHEFMIYDDVQTISVTDGSITGRADRDSSNQRRVAVHSMFYNDIRHDYSNNAKGTGTICIRGNIRQVGSKIVYCGPGIINTSAHDQSPPETTVTGNKHNGDPGTNTQWLGLSNFKRCTWNWNFHEGTTTVGGVAKDPEHWFESDPSLVTYQRVWDTVAVPRGDDTRTFGSNGHDDYVSPVTETVTFTISFQNDFDQGPVHTLGSTTYELFIDAPKYFTSPAQMAAGVAFTDLGATNPPDDGHYWTFTMFCLQSSLDGNGAQMPVLTGFNGLDGWGLGHDPSQSGPVAGLPTLNNPITDFPDTADTQYRDLFPDCYMGDEIHFEYVITGGSNAFNGGNGNTDHRISAWFSHVEAKFQSSA